MISLLVLCTLAQDVSLTSSLVNAKGKTKVRLEGRTSLPDDAALRITLYRLDERAASGRLEPVATTVGSALAPVSQKRFTAEPSVHNGGGTFRAVVELNDEEQTDDARTRLVNVGAARRWEFTFHQWGDDFVPSLARPLGVLDGMRTDALVLLDKVERIAASADAWKKESAAVVKEAEALLKKLNASGTRASYPAANAEVVGVVSNMLASMQLIKWNADGSFAQVFDYHTGQPAQTHKHEPFSWDALRRYLNDAGDLAGRETALWLLKEFDRTRALKTRASAAMAARRVASELAAHEGLAPHAKALDGYFKECSDVLSEERSKAIAAELANIEKQLRDGRKR